ncbi:hypothetical protein D3C75_917990 [compost metagenome]
MRKGVGGFKRRNNPFGYAEQLQGFQCFIIRNGYIPGTVDIFEVGMLRSYSGIVQTGGYGMRLLYLSMLILQQIA